MEECRCINSQEFKDLKDRITDHDKRITKIESNRELQEYQHTQVMGILNELKIDMKEIKEKPGKRWDLIIGGIITAVIGAIVTFIVTKK